MTAAYVSAPRVTASMPTIVDHWAELDPPELHSHYIGWGEPFFTLECMDPEAEWIAQQLAAAPLLTAERRSRLAELFRPIRVPVVDERAGAA